MADREVIRARLEQQLAGLEQRTRHIASDLKRTGDPDSAEQALQRENDEVLERLDEVERAALQAIREALRRLDTGRYGLCASCGSEIEPARLEALPTVTTCVGCAR